LPRNTSIFTINNFITLKLEKNATNIYINNKLFKQCKFLLLSLTKENLKGMEKIESIDEVSAYLNFSLEPEAEESTQEIIDEIKPETEFWGHCSNIQGWVEHNYDTRFLHSSLAFPLLRKLTEEGDLLARKKFKEEIAKRYFYGTENVRRFLEEEGYLRYLKREEISCFIHSGVNVIHELEEILKKELLERYTKSKEYSEEQFHLTTLPEYFTDVLIRDGEVIGLDLSGFGLAKLPDCIQKLIHLEILNLVGNKLTEIPEWIEELQSLKKLIAVSNSIIKIPESIGKLKSLEVLDLAQNEIIELPESIGDLSSIKEISLNHNHIKKIPESIGKLKTLEIIYIAMNSINSIPESIGSLDKLQDLRVGENPIKNLPSSLCNLPLLKEIIIRGTNITERNKVIDKLKKKKVKIYF